MKKNLNTKTTYTIIYCFTSNEGEDTFSEKIIEGKALSLLATMAKNQEKLANEGYKLNTITKDGSICCTAYKRTETGCYNESHYLDIA